MTRSNENNSATWPDPLTNPEGWAQRAKRYLCALMNMQGSLFESVIDQRDVIALACIAVLKDEGNFGNKSRLMAIHAREMAARAELRDGLAAQRAKEKAEVKLKQEKGKQAALDTPAKDPAIDKLNDSLAALAEAEAEVSDLTPAMGTDAKTGEIIPAEPEPPSPIAQTWEMRKAIIARYCDLYHVPPIDSKAISLGLNVVYNSEVWVNVADKMTLDENITHLEKFYAEHPPKAKREPEPPAKTETVAEKPSATEAKNGNAQTALVPVPEIVIDFRNALTKVKAANDLVRTMRDQKLLVMGRDYGKINEKNDKEKPSLWKPGAEKLCTAFELVPKFELIGKVETWDAEKPLFHYQYRCRLYKSTGEQIAEAVGSCNSREKKYRYRKVYAKGLAELGLKHDDIPANRRVELQGSNGKYWQYTIENDEVFDLVNTIDKMAQKRALIAAVLIGTNASEYFTQDTEHMLSFGYGDAIDAEIVA